tara:strand:+ start:128 stop:391 length:264 start_codon:yes stop_codon:yes gene_type:complete
VNSVQRKSIIEDLRGVTERMEEFGDVRIAFPTLEVERDGLSEEDIRCFHIKTSAKLIARLDDLDGNMYIPVRSLGMLVRYIADMMEE